MNRPLRISLSITLFAAALLGARGQLSQAPGAAGAPADPAPSSGDHAALAAPQAGAVRLAPSDDFSIRWQNPDGSITAYLSPQPIRRHDAAGAHGLTPLLAPSLAPGYAFEHAGDLNASFGPTASSWQTVSRGTASVSFALAEAGAAPGVAAAASQAPAALGPDGSSVRFADAFPGVDASLATDSAGNVKETLILKSRSAAPWNGEFAFRLALSGLDASVTTDASGSQVFFAASRTGVSSPVLRFTPIFAVDAAGARTDNGWYILADDRQSVVEVVDPNWLADPDRVYPVTIDPSITGTANAGWAQDSTTNDSASQSHSNFGTSTTLQEGYWGSGNPNYQTFVRLPLNFIPRGATISAATIDLGPVSFYDTSTAASIDVATVNQPWDQGTITASNQPTLTTYQTTSTATSGSGLDFQADVTSAVQAIWAGTARNDGVVLRKTPGTTNGVTFRSSEYSGTPHPSLIVTYSTSTSTLATTYNAPDAGAARRWQSAASLNPYQTLNLANGNVTTTLPVTGWQGFGPAVSFSLIHNSRQDPAISTNLAPKWTHSYASSLAFTGSSDPKSTVTVTGPDGAQDVYTYTSGAYVAPTGVYNTLAYASGAYSLTMVDQNVWAYNTSGVLQSITDPNGQAVTLHYNGSGQLTSVKDANPDSSKQRSLTLGYDGSGRILTIADPLGRVWETIYDSTFGDLQRLKIPRRTDGVSTSLEYCYWLGYDTMNDTSLTPNVVRGHLITNIGEPNDNPASNSTPTYEYAAEYDATGRGAACLGRSGLVYRGMHGLYVSYPDANDADVVDQTQVTNKTTFASGVLASKLLVTNPTATESSWTGPVTSYNWDSGNDLIGVRVPADQSLGTSYWTIQNTYGQSTAPGEVTQKLVNVNDPVNGSSTRVTQYTYDSNGHHRLILQKVKTQDSPSTDYQDTRTTFDADPTNGWINPTKVEVYADSDSGSLNSTNDRTTQFSYYSTSTYPGRVQYRTDPRGNQWSYAYDAWGNLTQTTSPSPGSRTVTIAYETTAHLLPATVDDGTAVTTTNYHTSGTNPDRRVTSRSVNTSGTPTSNVIWTPNGQATQPDNGISGSGSTAAVQQLYTDGGLVRQEVQHDDTIGYAYDPMGRLMETAYSVWVYHLRTSSPYTNHLNYYYSNLGHLTSQTWTAGYSGFAAKTISYAYDDDSCSCGGGQLAQETDSSGPVTYLTYDNLGEEVERQQETPTSTVLTTFTLHRRVNGQTDQIVRSDPGHTSSDFTKNLTYDIWGELTQETKLDGSSAEVSRQTYAYDGNGNRTSGSTYSGSGDTYTAASSFTYAYDTGNRMSSIVHLPGDPGTWTEDLTTSGNFDGNGNALKMHPNSGTVYQMSYYADNRLKTSQTTGSTDVETSSYDALGRLQSRTAGSTPTVYVYDGQQAILDRPSGSGDVTERVNGRVGTLAIDYTTWSGGAPAAQWLLYDGEGNAATTTDLTGSWVSSSTADLFATNASPSVEHNFLGSLGYRQRSNPGFYQVGERIYDPVSGRFLQQDPLSFGQGDYVYVGNEPADAVDPTGLMAIWSDDQTQRLGGRGAPDPAKCLAFYRAAQAANEARYQICTASFWRRIFGDCKAQLVIDNWNAYAAFVSCFLYW